MWYFAFGSEFWENSWNLYFTIFIVSVTFLALNTSTEFLFLSFFLFTYRSFFTEVANTYILDLYWYCIYYVSIFLKNYILFCFITIIVSTYTLLSIYLMVYQFICLTFHWKKFVNFMCVCVYKFYVYLVFLVLISILYINKLKQYG